MVHSGTRSGLFGDTRLRQVRGLCHVADEGAREVRTRRGRVFSPSPTYALRTFCLNSVVRVAATAVAIASVTHSGGLTVFWPVSGSALARERQARAHCTQACRVQHAPPWEISTCWGSSGPMAATCTQRVLGALWVSRELKSMQQAERLPSPCANQVMAPMMKSSMCMARVWCGAWRAR